MHYTASWAIQAAFVAIHEVHYTLLDSDFDAASDNMVLWYGCGPEFGNWSNRWPTWAKDLAPVHAEPKMEVVPAGTADAANKLLSYAEDVRDEQLGWIIRRRQTFAMPTLERERILNTTLTERRQPLLSSTFRRNQPPHVETENEAIKKHHRPLVNANLDHQSHDPIRPLQPKAEND